MSWIQMHGQTWPATQDEADLSVHLWLPDAACPRTSWSWRLLHAARAPGPDGKLAVHQWMSVDLHDLHFFEPDWTRLAGREIRADAAWHAAGDHVTEYGRHADAKVEVQASRTRIPGDSASLEKLGLWTGHEWVLRFGERDGWLLPCELDAWVYPAEEYYRTEPETAEEVRRASDRPPDLRIITCADFSGGSVRVPRTRERPGSWARRALREVIGCTDICATRTSVGCEHTPDEAWDGATPGPAATVDFSTHG